MVTVDDLVEAVALTRSGCNWKEKNVFLMYHRRRRSLSIDPVRTI